MLANAGASGIVLSTLVAGTVFACHPQGSIIKKVQDITTSSAVVDANTASSALTVNQGDILTYSITIANAETVEGDQNQADMLNTSLTDTLPAGVQLIGNPTQTTITENLGTIKAKGSITKQYQVKVTATQDGSILTNKACYTSTSNLGASYAQSGCDTAVVKVHVPTPIPTPVPTPTPPAPTPVVTPAAIVTPTAAALPNTGAGSSIALAIAIAILGYAANVLRLRRRATERA